jgi:probable F420-dependent oxidoreductase
VAVDNVRFGVGIPQVVEGSQLDVFALRDMLRATEELRFESAWIMDASLSPAPALEPITTLAFAAAATSSIRLGIGVIIAPLRQPVKLAMDLATLDQLSQGRLIVGLGLGDRTDHYPALGVSPDHRVGRLMEGLELIKRLWAEDGVTFSGRYWQTEDLTAQPKPYQRPHPPIWFGGGSEPAVVRAVRFGDGWMGAGSSTIEQFKEQASLVRATLDASGRDPGTLPIAKRLYIAVSPDRNRALDRMRAWSTIFYGNSRMADTAAVVGDMDYCMQKISEVRDAGAGLIVLNPVFDVIDQMEQLAAATTWS